MFGNIVEHFYILCQRSSSVKVCFGTDTTDIFWYLACSAVCLLLARYGQIHK